MTCNKTKNYHDGLDSKDFRSQRKAKPVLNQQQHNSTAHECKAILQKIVSRE